MAFELGVVLAALMGAAAALMGGVLAQRYQYMLERQKEHFAVLRDQVLEPWKRAVAARQANLEGRDPYVVVDYVAKDYRSSPGVSFGSGDNLPWTETSGLAESSRHHWPALWAEWRELNAALGELGGRIVALLRKVEADFPPLPPGKAWSNYGDQPAVAVKVAVVNAWSSFAQVAERRMYPDWVANQLTSFGFWKGDDSGREEYARLVVGAMERHSAEVGAIEAASEALWKRFAQFGRKVEDAIQTQRFTGTCAYCARFLR